MEILVTGGAGFIGSHLVERLLALGHGVTVLDDFNDFYSPAIKRDNLAAVRGRITLREVDLCQADAVTRVVREGKFGAIIHLAARAGVRPSIQKPRLYVETNVTGTLNLLEAARQHGVRRFVFASSSSVYGLCKNPPFREDEALPGTISPYAATKLAGEQLCSSYAHLYDLPTVCLRFFHGVRPAPAARSGDPPVHPAHPPGRDHRPVRRRQHAARLYLYRRHRAGDAGRAGSPGSALRHLQPRRKRDHAPE